VPDSRWVAIDVLKASAIVTVVWIHAFHGWDRPRSILIYLSTLLSSFAVPAFFFASGFLHWRSVPIPAALLLRWMSRVVPPYLVASAAAFALRAGANETFTARKMAFELAVGSASGIYYFVPVLAGALLLGPPLSRWRGLALPLFGAFWLTGLLCVAGLDPGVRVLFGGPNVFWSLRDPLRWWGYFLAGWLVAERWRGRRDGSAVLRRVGLAAAGLVGTVVAAVAIHLARSAPSAWAWPIPAGLLYLVTYGCLVAIFVLARDAPPSRTVRVLSQASYPVYLYHVFFITLARRALPLPEPALDGAAFVVGCGGSLALVSLGRVLLGRHARVILG